MTGAAHTRTSTDAGPDFCDECSHAADNWVTWPCPAVAHAQPEAERMPGAQVTTCRCGARWEHNAYPDRACRLCGHVGHVATVPDCPVRGS